MINAKPISNKFWILKDDNGKIGEVNANRNGYVVNIKGKHATFKSLELLKIKTGINFTDAVKTNQTDDTAIYGFPYNGKKFNEVWDLKLKLPLFTKKEDSKSWFVAGYFSVKIKGKWRTILSPKLLIIQRNEFKGPYKSNPTEQPTEKTLFKDGSLLNKWFN